MDVNNLRKKINLKFSELLILKTKILVKNKMIKGSVYTLKRKCGNPNCKCHHGELHSSICLSYSETGKTKLKMLKDKKEISNYQKKTGMYREFRQCRAKIVRLTKEIMELINQYEKIMIIKE